MGQARFSSSETREIFIGILEQIGLINAGHVSSGVSRPTEGNFFTWNSGHIPLTRDFFVTAIRDSDFPDGWKDKLKQAAPSYLALEVDEFTTF